ncbi:hypothetical protein ACFLXN_02585 [Chloroflexota bacterium]
MLYILTGYGISEFRIIESITFGLLSKPLAFKIHHYLIYPMAGLLTVHIAVPIILRLVHKSRNRVNISSRRVVKLVK